MWQLIIHDSHQARLNPTQEQAAHLAVAQESEERERARQEREEREQQELDGSQILSAL